MEKRGQFFLIAAFIIVSILFGLATIYNFVRAPKEQTWVYDLSKEINEESAQIINQGVLIGQESDISGRLDSLIANYSKLYSSSEIAIIYGKKGQNQPILKKYYYCQPSATSLGSAQIESCSRKIDPDLSGSGKMTISDLNIVLNLSGSPYSFDIPQGENNYFYIVIRSPSGGQQTVSTSESLRL